MKYVVLNQDITVAYTFPVIDARRPTIPVNELYSEEFLSSCVLVEDDTETPTGWAYDSETGTFSAPPETEPPVE